MTIPAMPVRQRMTRFAAVGVAACLVDMAIVETLTRSEVADLYGARVISYLGAATVAWRLNRSLTFADRRSDTQLAEWARYLVVNLGGGAINYLVYGLLVATFPLFASLPSLAVALGSLAGMSGNFVASGALVFRRA